MGIRVEGSGYRCGVGKHAGKDTGKAYKAKLTCESRRECGMVKGEGRWGGRRHVVCMAAGCRMGSSGKGNTAHSSHKACRAEEFLAK